MTVEQHRARDSIVQPVLFKRMFITLKGFCFGHLIHGCLMLARQILHFTSRDPAVRVSPFCRSEKDAKTFLLMLHCSRYPP